MRFRDGALLVERFNTLLLNLRLALADDRLIQFLEYAQTVILVQEGIIV